MPIAVAGVHCHYGWLVACLVACLAACLARFGLPDVLDSWGSVSNGFSMPAGKVRRFLFCCDYHMKCASLHQLGFAMDRGWFGRGRWVLQNHCHTH